MVPTGAVDSVIHDLLPLLERGDILIDGGNSYYIDDIRRAKDLACRGIHYVDVGTIEEWTKYNDKPVVFCDIDGTIIKTKDFHDDAYEPIQGNVDALLKEQARGCKLVFVTARKKKYEQYTNEILTELGFVDYFLIFLYIPLFFHNIFLMLFLFSFPLLLRILPVYF